jgi:voltage-gated potassium channel
MARRLRPGQDPIAIFQATRRRMFFALGLLFVVLNVGSAGYWYLGNMYQPGMWRFQDCVYMTAITITTVGYGEVLDVSTVPLGREWTLLLLVFGISANLYVVSAITSFFVESDFTNVRRYRRLQRRMHEIRDHYILCGAGRTGRHVAGELMAIGEQLVIVDESEKLLDEFREMGILTLCADATEDETLETAGIHRAKGVVAALDDDKTNMFVVVSARQTNPRLRIVTKAVGASAMAKLRRAGADAVVSPAMIGGMRLASELIRPQVVRFLDEMLRDKDAALRIEEATVAAGGKAEGQTLRESNLRERSGTLILAVREPDGKVNYVPESDHVLRPGQTLIAIGNPAQITALRNAVGSPP